ncbi:hypothetical protein EXU30_02130 [Shewanella maritima]|uniref:Uncharacterized protein n=2 Tax=Shewanella maritima TaxID=2520507 RepID=A0A411PML9_9GAMM|nr:hypothetical protein [Shewanella maritima]QBF84756.1 hypothetical protein EXU30_02130 [Shewanella maritima]
MNGLVEYEASMLVDLLESGDSLRVHMFMDAMGMPFDVQDRLLNEFSGLKHVDQQQIADIIEDQGQHSLSSHLTL